MYFHLAYWDCLPPQYVGQNQREYFFFIHFKNGCLYVSIRSDWAIKGRVFVHARHWVRNFNFSSSQSRKRLCLSLITTYCLFADNTSASKMPHSSNVHAEAHFSLKWEAHCSVWGKRRESIFPNLLQKACNQNQQGEIKNLYPAFLSITDNTQKHNGTGILVAVRFRLPLDIMWLHLGLDGWWSLLLTFKPIPQTYIT